MRRDRCFVGGAIEVLDVARGRRVQHGGCKAMIRRCGAKARDTKRGARSGGTHEGFQAQCTPWKARGEARRLRTGRRGCGRWAPGGAARSAAPCSDRGVRIGWALEACLGPRRAGPEGAGTWRRSALDRPREQVGEGASNAAEGGGNVEWHEGARSVCGSKSTGTSRHAAARSPHPGAPQWPPDHATGPQDPGRSASEHSPELSRGGAGTASAGTRGANPTSRLHGSTPPPPHPHPVQCACID